MPDGMSGAFQAYYADCFQPWQRILSYCLSSPSIDLPVSQQVGAGNLTMKDWSLHRRNEMINCVATLQCQHRVAFNARTFHREDRNLPSSRSCHSTYSSYSYSAAANVEGRVREETNLTCSGCARLQAYCTSPQDHLIAPPDCPS